MTRRLRHLNRTLGLPSAPPPFELDTNRVCRRVHDTLVTDEKERRAYMKQRIKFAAVLVAAAVALTGTALAVGPTVQEMIRGFLGSFAPYTQEVIGVSAIDQGIEIKATTAISDHRNAKVFLEVRDLKGSRIPNENLELSIYAHRAAAESFHEGIRWVSRGRHVGYNAETRTALYVFELASMNPAFDSTAPLLLNITSVSPGVQSLNDQPLLPTENLNAKALASKHLTTGKTVLAPNQTYTEFAGTKGGSLSSIGFGTDGLLHIQFKLPEGALKEDNTVDVFVWQASKDPKRTRDYYDCESVYFTEKGVLYKDLTYPIKAEELGDIHIEEMSGGYRTAVDIEGEWNLSIPLTEIPEHTIMVNQSLGGLMIKNISLTPLSATADVVPIPGEKVHYAIPGLQLTLYMKDGSIIPVKDKYNWTFKDPINTANIAAIAIGQWYMPLDGDTALPGYWLAELPG